MKDLDWAAVVELGIAVCAFLGAGISLWVTSKIDDKVDAAMEKVRTEEVKPLAAEIRNNRHRIANLEQQCQSLATSKDVHSIALSVERVVGELKALGQKVMDLGERQTATQQSVESVNRYLLSEKG